MQNSTSPAPANVLTGSVVNNSRTPDPTTVKSTSPASKPSVDIEHVPVTNDPRQWSNARKNISLALISSAAMIAGLAGNIQNPAVEDMERDLPATSSQFSLSISIFILIQGLMPLVWSAISEVKGRKLVYLTSLGLFTLGSIVVALSKNIKLVIGFRCFQAAGSSAVISIGAATLADIFEPSERGSKMGIYYIAPLLGPALGPIIGGVLTTGLSWRAIFWFLAIVSGLSLTLFLLFFNDTFRCERSLTYQNVVKDRMKAMSRSPSPEPGHERPHSPQFPFPHFKKENIKNTKPDSNQDVEKQATDLGLHTAGPNENMQAAMPIVKLSLKDVNPFKPLKLVLMRKNNIAILFASGLLFAFSYLIAYTTARTLSSRYHLNALKIGLVSLSFGFGCVAGSLLGGRWSDRLLARLKAMNGGVSYPEMRLKSTVFGVCMLPPCLLAYGWACDRRVHVSVVCVLLFACGFFSVWTYSSTLAYIVDANNGRSSSAVATNSAFRGVSAFVSTEIAVPLQDGLGDGWTYTIWAALVLLSGLLILLVSWKGEKWREQAETREATNSESS